MKIGVSVRIDVSKIDKSKLYSGKKGKYLDLTTFIDLDQADQYENNGFVTQSQTKEERATGEKMPILGNVKVFFKDSAVSPEQQYQQTGQMSKPPVKNAPPAEQWDDESIPF